MSNKGVLGKTRSVDAKGLYLEAFGSYSRNAQTNAVRIQPSRKKSYLPLREDLEGEFGLSGKEPSLAWRNKLDRNIFGVTVASRNYISGIRLDSVSNRRFILNPTVSKAGRMRMVQDAEQATSNSFVDRASQLVRRGQIDSALDLIYDQIDSLLRSEKMDRINSILERVDPSKLSLDLMLGLLTATLPARTRLASRKMFFIEVEKTLKLRGEWEDGLLAGLES